MPYFLGGPKIRFVDSNNQPLSGGKVFTYSGGTTTPLATYPTIADANAATNANSNPITLDSRGETIMVMLDSSYKIVLKDSVDNVIWTVDQIYVTSNSMIYDNAGNPIFILSGTNITVGAIDTTGITIGNSSTTTCYFKASSGTLQLAYSSGLVLSTSTNLAVNSTGGTLSLSSNSTLPVASTSVKLSSDQPITGSTGSSIITPAKSGTASSIALYEDAANGTNKTTIASPSNMTGDVTLTLPAAQNTVTAPIVYTSSGVGQFGTLVSSQTVSAVSQINFTDITKYRRYVLVADSLIASAVSGNIRIKFSVDSGLSYISTSSYVWAGTGTDGGTPFAQGTVNDTSGNLLCNLHNSGSKIGGFIINIWGQNSASRFVQWTVQGASYNGSAAHSHTAGGYLNVLSTNAVQLLCVSGTVTGVFELYGSS